MQRTGAPIAEGRHADCRAPARRLPRAGAPIAERRGRDCRAPARRVQSAGAPSQSAGALSARLLHFGPTCSLQVLPTWRPSRAEASGEEPAGFRRGTRTQTARARPRQPRRGAPSAPQQAAPQRGMLRGQLSRTAELRPWGNDTPPDLHVKRSRPPRQTAQNYQ